MSAFVLFVRCFEGFPPPLPLFGETFFPENCKLMLSVLGSVIKHTVVCAVLTPDGSASSLLRSGRAQTLFWG